MARCNCKPCTPKPKNVLPVTPPNNNLQPPKPKPDSPCCPSNTVTHITKVGNKLVITMDDCTFYEVDYSLLDLDSLKITGSSTSNFDLDKLKEELKKLSTEELEKLKEELKNSISSDITSSLDNKILDVVNSTLDTKLTEKITEKLNEVLELKVRDAVDRILNNQPTPTAPDYSDLIERLVSEKVKAFVETLSTEIPSLVEGLVPSIDRIIENIPKASESTFGLVKLKDQLQTANGVSMGYTTTVKDED